MTPPDSHCLSRMSRGCLQLPCSSHNLIIVSYPNGESVAGEGESNPEGIIKRSGLLSGSDLHPTSVVSGSLEAFGTFSEIFNLPPAHSKITPDSKILPLPGITTQRPPTRRPLIRTCTFRATPHLSIRLPCFTVVPSLRGRPHRIKPKVVVECLNGLSVVSCSASSQPLDCWLGRVQSCTSS